MKIGIALSGGGYRAAAFHTGVLTRLAKDKLIEDFEILSTVSGGTIAIGLAFLSNALQWPSSDGYLENTVPHIFAALTRATLQKLVLRDLLLSPSRLIESRASLISNRLKTQIGMNINADQLPESPRWIINCTCNETGENFRFERRRAEDYKVVYVAAPEIPLSDAKAASADVPVLVGPLTLKSNKYDWYAYDEMGNRIRLHESELSKILHLWDGGVYDNSGIETLITNAGPQKSVSYRPPIDYLIVSRASGKADWQDDRPGLDAEVRLIPIPDSQELSHPSRDRLQRFGKHKRGVHGSARINTEIKNLSPEQFFLLFRQGFEVADSALHAFDPGKFEMHGFNLQHWQNRLA